MELEPLGSSKGNDCREDEISEQQIVSYMEVTWDETRIQSIYFKINDLNNMTNYAVVLYGTRRSINKVQGWSFNDKN